MHKTRYFLKNLGILTISNLTSKILVFLLVPLYTAVLSTEEVGIYDLIIASSQLLYPILTLNIVAAVMRFALDANRKTNEAIAVIGFKFVLFSDVIIAVSLYIISRMNFFAEIQNLTLIILVYYVFYGLNQYLIHFAKGIEHVIDMGIAGIISSFIVLLSSLLFLLVFKWGLNGFFLALILGQAFPDIYLFVRLRMHSYLNKMASDTAVQMDMLRYSVPLIFTEIGWWINQASDRYIVSAVCGIAATGILSVSYKIPHIISSLHGIMIQAWHISAIKEYGKDDSEKFYGDIFQMINLFLCSVSAVLIMFCKPLARILFANDFYSAWQYVPFLLISSVINSAAGMCGAVLVAQKKTKEMGKSAIWGASINIILNIIFVLCIGIQGVTVATAIASLVIYVYRKHAVGIGMKVDHYSLIILIWVLLCIQAILEINNLWFYIELIIMTLVIAMSGILFGHNIKKYNNKME